MPLKASAKQAAKDKYNTPRSLCDGSYIGYYTGYPRLLHKLSLFPGLCAGFLGWVDILLDNLLDNSRPQKYQSQKYQVVTDGYGSHTTAAKVN